MSQPTQGNSSASSFGACSVCLKSGIAIVSTTGLLWRHGPRGNACVGSGGLPKPGSIQLRAVPGAVTQAAAASNDTSVDTFGYPTVSQPLQPTFSHPELSTPIPKRIPKGAHIQAANLLVRLLRGVLSDPNHLPAWERLLAFVSGCLTRPARGGRSNNLTTLVLRQIQVFESKGSNARSEEWHGYFVNQKMVRKT